MRLSESLAALPTLDEVRQERARRSLGAFAIRMLGLVPARHHEFVNQKLEAVELVNSLDEEQKRAAEEGLSEDELALFDLLQKDSLGKAERERVKQASQELLASLQELVAGLDRFWEKEQTQAEVEVFILDRLFEALPTPPFTEEEKEEAARKVYQHVWQQAASGMFSEAA